MTSPDTIFVTWTVRTCPTCGVHYALDAAFNKRNYELGQSWYCPNGHSLVFTTDKATKLEKSLAESNKALMKAADDRDYFAKRLDETDKELSTTRATLKGSKTRLRNLKTRISAGVCPCCQRTFQNVARHIAGQHPNWKQEYENESNSE